MERQRIGIVVYLHISIVLGDNFVDTFKSETMRMAVGYTYSWITVFRYERICSAGIYDRQNYKWSFYFFACTNFNKGFWNVFSRFYSIVEQIAEQ